MKIKKITVLILAVLFTAFFVVACVVPENGGNNGSTTYNITFSLHSAAANPNETTFTNDDLPLVLLPATREGFTFTGWFDAATGGSQVEEITQTGNVSLWGRFVLTDYSITFNNVLASEHGNAVSFNIGSLPLNLLPATREGYSFVGWFNAPSNGEEISQITQLRNTAVYARFNLNSFNITYTLNGGTNHSENPTSFNINDRPINLMNATREGYIFQGWFDNAGFIGNPITQITTLSNHYLFAKWTPVPVYSITFIIPINAVHYNPLTFVETDFPLELEGAYLFGHDFDGWFDNPEFERDEITSITESGNITLYGKFTLIKFTAIFNGVTESEHENQNIFTVEDLPLTLLSAYRKGFRFDGWFDAETDGYLIEEITQADNTILFAKWTPLYTLTFNVPDGAAHYNQETFAHDELPLKLLPARHALVGYSFVGWFDNDEFLGTSITQVSTLSNHEFYAKFEPLMSEFFEGFPNASREVVVISAAGLTRSEFIMVTSIQGLVAQTAPQIFIDTTFYMPHLRFIIENYEGFSYTRVDCPWELVDMFRDHITDNGFVRYNETTQGLPSLQNSVNAAATISGVEGWLMVASHPNDIARAEELGLVQKRDATDINTYYQMRDLFNEYKSRLNRRHVLHQNPINNSMGRNMRDLSIALGAFTFYTRESPEDRQFRREVFEWMEPNSPVWGWAPEEINFVFDMSMHGNFVLPSDWSSNVSFLAGVREGGPFEQPRQDRVIQGQQGNHYIALVISDGDNVQWMARDFAMDANQNFGYRYRRHNSNNPMDFIINWTFAPSIGEFKEPVIRNIYNMAKTTAPYYLDSFVAGVSGVGYGNPMRFPIQHLPAFAESTARHMENAGLEVLTLLDNINHLQQDAAAAGMSMHDFAASRLNYFTMHDQIRGGIWMMDPSRYEGGTGRVFWSNGKPFISMRLSVWHPSNNRDLVNREWLRAYAERINSFSTNYRTIDGYSMINIHPWTVRMEREHLDILVSYLAPHVQIISAGELICMVTRYVPQVYRNPGNGGPIPW
ncbi:MAG: InlB B-repeat-containing protein [Firmicutes bacterium]|nr:InlB B-repeat-containing protein [Bacillota bacterium]